MAGWTCPDRENIIWDGTINSNKLKTHEASMGDIDGTSLVLTTSSDNDSAQILSLYNVPAANNGVCIGYGEGLGSTMQAGYDGSANDFFIRKTGGGKYFSVARDTGNINITGTIGINTTALTGTGIAIKTDSTKTQGLRVENDTTTRLAFSTFVTGDAQVRGVWMADGTIKFGDGTNAADTNLYRDAANSLKTDDAFTANSIAKIGGASTEFLKADGSVDTSTYYKSGDSPSFATITGTSLIITNNSVNSTITYDGTNRRMIFTSVGVGATTSKYRWMGEGSTNDPYVDLTIDTNGNVMFDGDPGNGGAYITFNFNDCPISTTRAVTAGSFKPSGTNVTLDGNVDILSNSLNFVIGSTSGQINFNDTSEVFELDDPLDLVAGDLRLGGQSRIANAGEFLSSDGSSGVTFTADVYNDGTTSGQLTYISVKDGIVVDYGVIP